VAAATRSTSGSTSITARATTYNGLDELALILPDELERIEVLERGAMLRIHTREIIKKLLGGGVRLARPLYVPQARPPLCH
jgi:hypothetical protein